MTAPKWILKSARISNILGFLGSKDFVFSPGLQVLQADNHTGKTSLALALLWGLTGQLPSIGHINANQFKLKNKAAAEGAEASIIVTLTNVQGGELSLTRRLKPAKLSVRLGETTYEDKAAQEVLYNQLGMKHSSLEGTCIILRDMRLNLLTGDLKKNSDVIHEILGLSILSKLVPILTDKISKLTKLHDNYAHYDPRKQWEERHQQLVNDLKEKEGQATREGCNPKEFSSSSFLHNQLSKLCEELHMPTLSQDLPIKEALDAIRKALFVKRQQNPLRAKREELLTKTQQLKESCEKLQRASTSLKEIANAYTNSANTYKSSAETLVVQLTTLQSTLAAKQSTLHLLKEQQGLYAYSLKLLEQQNELSNCPLCNQDIHRETLLKGIREKLATSSGTLISSHEREVAQLTNEKLNLEELQREYRAMERDLRVHLQEGLRALQLLNIKNEVIAQSIENPLKNLAVILHAFEAIESKSREALEGGLSELAQHSNHIKIEEEKLLPIEQRLYQIAMLFLPIHDLHQKLIAHELLKDAGSSQAQALGALLQKTKGYIHQLTALKNILQKQEKEKATASMQEHQEFVSRFFAQVANNPDYDRIEIGAKEMHGSVKYEITASSSKSPAYTDTAKHVLSGGDLSCACLGLIFSLMRGRSDKTNFLVLDDPGESLDAIRMDNLATALQNNTGQAIILTHQQELADKLLKIGATASYL